jgi:hypothetical protein
MKTTFYLLSLLLLPMLCISQESYTMKMTVKTEGLPPEFSAYGEQDIVTYIKGEKSKTEVSSMMFNTVVYYDGKTMTSVSDAMGSKTGFVATKEELEADENKKKTKPTIEYTTEKRNIAGFDCSKAIITSMGDDKKEQKIIVWVTDKIKANSSHRKASGGMADFSDLKGTPLAMEMNKNYQGSDMKIVMTTTEVLTDPLDDSLFKVSTDGYTMMSYKEMKEKSKAMKGQ